MGRYAGSCVKARRPASINLYIPTFGRKEGRAIFSSIYMTDKVRLRPIMFVGTGSDVGKSVITAGFCRIFRQDGLQPAPFKAQNMSLNSYATPEGFEIGRAQAVQAEACGVPCHTDMNPVLLKPVSDQKSQVILHGKPTGNYSASEYFLSGNRDVLFAEVKKAFHKLAARYNPIVMEGAGSISELNLRDRDITNLRMAIEADAATYLIADIDRGGIFGSLYGTMELLTPRERKCIKGIIVNKFRGDIKLFEDGIKTLEQLCKVPVMGVVPYYKDIFIEEEDSLQNWKRNRPASEGKIAEADLSESTLPEGKLPERKINIAVIRLSHLSNFTDFDRLARDSRVNLYYSREPAEILTADIIILPGSKNTIEDLLELHRNGATAAIQECHRQNKTVIGICGGYQMMGELVEDPLHVESGADHAPGLGILPVRTVLKAEKTTLQRNFHFLGAGETITGETGTGETGTGGICSGYEIHMGETIPTGPAKPLNTFPQGDTDGYYQGPTCWGTYLHGILDNPGIITALLKPFTDQPGDNSNYASFKDQQYDKLADHLRKHLNIEAIYKTMQI